MSARHVGLPRRCLVEGASELCRPEPEGSGVRRCPEEVIYVDDGRVAYIGPCESLPAQADGAPTFDVGGRALLPAFIDAHTHIVFGGDRTEDFARRASGMSYLEIAQAGGGIQTTVKATRACATEALVDRARRHLATRRDLGVLTTEIKSGYGLDIATELRMLEAVAALRADGWDVEGTLLAAHALPVDQPRDEWVDTICAELIPEVARRKWARFVDVFVEEGAYTPNEARRVAEAAADHGLRMRLHADQITAGGGAELAAELGAVSADHLERISSAGIRRLSEARVCAGLLPGAMLHLSDQAPGLGRRLIDGGVEVFVATDANPGSSPTHNLALMATLAVTQMGLTAEEALRACTLGAARALEREDLGHLEVGARAHFVVLDHPDARAWVAAFGESTVAEVWVAAEA